MNDAEPLKAYPMQVRMNFAWKDRIENAANKVRQQPSTLARILLETFTEQVEQHGDRMVWPPKFLIHAQPTPPADKPLIATLEKIVAPLDKQTVAIESTRSASDAVDAYPKPKSAGDKATKETPQTRPLPAAQKSRAGRVRLAGAPARRNL